MRNDQERLLDILEAIERIEKYTVRGRSTFDGDELIQTWVLHHLQIIGEAVRAMSVDTKQKIEDVEWSKIIGMRNILVHNYFGIDADVVWAAVENDIHTLKLTRDFSKKNTPNNIFSTRNEITSVLLIYQNDEYKILRRSRNCYGFEVFA